MGLSGPSCISVLFSTLWFGTAAGQLVATGQVTYNYSGPKFTTVTGPNPGTHISAQFVLTSSPVTLANFVFAGGYTDICLEGSSSILGSNPLGLTCSTTPPNLASWQISDGVNTITSGSGGVLTSLSFVTDPTAALIAWNFVAQEGTAVLQTANTSGFNVEPSSRDSSTINGSQSFGGGDGTWSATYSVPPPSLFGGTGYGLAAPGGIATIFGAFAGFPTGQPQSAGPLPTSLDGVQITIDGVAAPLYYVSPNQINIQVPWQTTGQYIGGCCESTLTISGPFSIGVSEVSALVRMPPQICPSNVGCFDQSQPEPGIFEMNPQHQAAALDANSHLIGPTNPTSAGSIIQIYCTGLGPVTAPQMDGVPAPLDEPVYTTSTPDVFIGFTRAQVLFAGLAPGSVGLYQINAVVPSLPIGTESLEPLIIAFDGASSNTTTLSVH